MAPHDDLLSTPLGTGYHASTYDDPVTLGEDMPHLAPEAGMNNMIVVDKEGNEFDLQPIDCPTCHVKAEKVLGYRGGEHHRYGLGISTRIVRCGRCDLIFPDPFPFPLEAQKLYGDPDKYFEHHDQAEKVRNQRELVKSILSRTKSTHPSIIDVGSGRGELLQAAHLEGLEDVVGLEFADAMIEYAATHYGAIVHHESIEKHADRIGRTYDAVVLNAVLEHVYDPDSMVASAARLTQPGSVFYLNLPVEPNLLTMVGNRVNRLRRSQTVFNISPTFSPFHVFGFNRKALTTLLAKHNFTIDSVRVWARPDIPAGPERADKVRAFVGTQVNRLANVSGTASDMCVWASRTS